MLVARPLSVMLVLCLANMPFREKLLVAWVGLRGAVPIVLATFPLLAGVPRAEALFNLVFFIVLTSVLMQGTSIPLVARWLGVDAPLPAATERPVEALATDARGSVLTEFRIPEPSPAVGRQVVDLGLSDRALIVLIKRGDEGIVPGGGTVIEAEDVLVVLCEQPSIDATRKLLGARDASA
jgi:cell volume regulation protein A